MPDVSPLAPGGRDGSNARMGRQGTTRVGIDTGGTFTDVVWIERGQRRTAKVPSTPARPDEAFLAGLAAVGGVGAGAHVHHGTTVGTNAVLTRSGARIAFVTTAGFEDLPWIGRGGRDDLHALTPSRTPPLFARRLVFGVEERIDAGGRVLVRPSAAGLQRLRGDLERAKPDAVAVCLLHAVRNDVHERAVLRAVRTLGVPVHLSSRSCADPREVERATTVALDAYVAPVLGAYLGDVAKRLAPAARRALTIMRSDGGRMSVREVARGPARTLLSGPAAGVAAARALARELNVPRVLSFDVGGTSTDVAWIEGDDLAVRPSLRVGPFEAGVPSVGIETVGAGGGSEVWIDPGGALRVGPRSAGADPGPAAYGRGGPFTLTDAWLLSGRVPEALLGGAFPLVRAAAEKAALRVARAARCTIDELCQGVVAVAAAATARALRLASVAQGHDPRRAVLIAFGGAGAVLAAETAALLGIDAVIVPTDPGTFAAEGTLLAPLRADAAEVVGDRSELGRRERRLSARVRKELQREGARRVRVRTELDARYAGQAFEVTVPHSATWERAFHARHADRYGFSTPDRDVEVVRVRVRGEGATSVARGATQARTSGGRVRARRGSVFQRADLRPRDRVRGPARIEELSGTTWVPRGWSADVLSAGALRLMRGAR